MISGNAVRINPGYQDNDFWDMANGRSNRYSGTAANSEMMKILA